MVPFFFGGGGGGGGSGEELYRGLTEGGSWGVGTSRTLGKLWGP